MFIKTLGLMSVVTTFAVLSASVATAGSHETDLTNFNKKELNGRSSYFGVAYLSSDISDVTFSQGSNSNDESGVRTTNEVSFDDANGYLVTIGNDYGYVRLETEFGYHDTKVTKVQTGLNGGGAVDIGTAMVNLAVEYSIDPSDLAGSGSSGFSLTPFVQVGGGAFGVHGNLNYLSSGDGEAYGVDNGFFLAPAIQGAAGLTIGLPMGAELFAQYSEMLAYTYNYRDSDDVHVQQVSGGLRINF